MIKLCIDCPSYDSDDLKTCCNEFQDPRLQCPLGVIKHVLFDESIDNCWTVLPGDVSDIEMSHILKLAEAWQQ
jgi:hypothetical protein